MANPQLSAQLTACGLDSRVDEVFVVSFAIRTLHAAQDVAAAAIYFQRSRDLLIDCLEREPDNESAAKKLARLEADFKKLVDENQLNDTQQELHKASLSH